MPVYLEHISQPTEQDWIDLDKIYSDCPQQWLSDASDIKASLQSLLDQQAWLIGGRFNSRLLGAVIAAKDGSNVTLQHLCVREITRNRGVAHQLLHHLSGWADENAYTLIAKNIPLELFGSLEKRGFKQESNSANTESGNFKRNPS